MRLNGTGVYGNLDSELSNDLSETTQLGVQEMSEGYYSKNGNS